MDDFKIAARLFSINKFIATSPAYYYLLQNKVNEEVLSYIDLGLNYDEYASDLLKAKVEICYILGKRADANRAFYRLALIAPNDPFVKNMWNKVNNSE